jgi:hypothetical protein
MTPPADVSPQPEATPWSNLGIALGIHLAAVALFAVGVWLMVFMDWLGILSAGMIVLSTLFLLASALLYLVSLPVFLGVTFAALRNRNVVAGLLSLLVTAAVFAEGWYAAGVVLRGGMPGLVALFGGSGLRF